MLDNFWWIMVDSWSRRSLLGDGFEVNRFTAETAEFLTAFATQAEAHS
jgi:hypothetical protein